MHFSIPDTAEINDGNGSSFTVSVTCLTAHVIVKMCCSCVRLDLGLVETLSGCCQLSLRPVRARVTVTLVVLVLGGVAVCRAEHAV